MAVATLPAVPPTEPAKRGSLLEIDGLSVQFPSGRDWITVVDDVNLTIPAGETVGLVGESGSGKTATALALMGLVPEVGGRVTSGSVHFNGRDLLAASTSELDRLRGRDIAMIFQQPARSLNPAFRVGDQLAETIRRHLGFGRKAAKARAIEMLDRVHISDAAKRADDYPHEFSGGQAQRIMIAMAISCGPKLLVADEPTTALDATVQNKVLDLLRDLQADTGIAMLLISHDLAVIAQMCERVSVMYAGHVVEQAGTNDIVHHARHPYTSGLLKSVMSVQSRSRRLLAIPGSLPSFDDLPNGCRFNPRCSFCVPEVCTAAPIPLTRIVGTDRTTRCARAGEIFSDASHG